MLGTASMNATPADRCAGKLIGTGPFTISSYEDNRGATLVSRKGYNWPSPLYSAKGDSKLKEIRFTVVPDSNVRAGNLTSGQADVGTQLANQNLPQLKSSKVTIVTRIQPGVPISGLKRPLISVNGMARCPL